MDCKVQFITQNSTTGTMLTRCLGSFYTMKQETSTIIALALDNWKTQISRATKLFETLTDEQLEKESSTQSKH
jgi:hypothetical protein